MGGPLPLGKPPEEKICFCLDFFEGSGGGGGVMSESYLFKELFCSVNVWTFFTKGGGLPQGSHPEKKTAYFWTLSKRVGGKPESKSFGVIFFGPSFGHYGGKRGGVEPIPKVLG